MLSIGGDRRPEPEAMAALDGYILLHTDRNG
jgi:hypothetical protein